MFLSNVPADYKQGTDYVAIVTDDLFQMGKQAADVLAKALGGKGKVGWIFHDAQYYVTNQRDNAFKTTIENDYPGMEIVAEPGHRRPGAGRGDRPAPCCCKTPTSTASTSPGPSRPTACWRRCAPAATRKTKVVTLDLSEPVALDMVKGGNVAGDRRRQGLRARPHHGGGGR